jgi:hypothetical protein
VRSVAAAGLLCLLAVPSLAQSNPNLEGCVYPTDVPEQAVAEAIMSLALPYLDKEVIYYRDGSGQSLGSYAVRRSLRIYFYDKNDVLMGTALRRSQETTSYFGPAGNYLGNCVHHQLVRPDRDNLRFYPAAQ